MEKDLYTLLNQVKTELNEYEEVELSSFEHKKNCNRIISKIKVEKKKETKSVSRKGKKIAVAVVVLFCGLISATTISYASEGKYFKPFYTFFNGSAVSYEVGEEESSMSVEMNATENPPVELRGDKLYFIADGNEIDITNLISTTKPYINEVVDSEGNIHKFIIGGIAKEGRYGYYECLFDRNARFIAGSGYYPNDTETEWLSVGREELGLN